MGSWIPYADGLNDWALVLNEECQFSTGHTTIYMKKLAKSYDAIIAGKAPFFFLAFGAAVDFPLFYHRSYGDFLRDVVLVLHPD